MSTDLHATAEVALGARLLRRRGRASAGRAGRGRGPRRRHTASLLVRTCFKASGAGGDAAGAAAAGAGDAAAALFCCCALPVVPPEGRGVSD